MKIKPKITIKNDFAFLTNNHYFIQSTESRNWFVSLTGTDTENNIHQFGWVRGHVGAMALPMMEAQQWLQAHPELENKVKLTHAKKYIINYTKKYFSGKVHGLKLQSAK